MANITIRWCTPGCTHQTARTKSVFVVWLHLWQSKCRGEHSLCPARPNTKSSVFHVFRARGSWQKAKARTILLSGMPLTHGHMLLAYSSLQNRWVSQRARLCLRKSFHTTSDQHHDVIAQGRGISNSLHFKINNSWLLFFSRCAYSLGLFLFDPVKQNPGLFIYWDRVYLSQRI